MEKTIEPQKIIISRGSNLQDGGDRWFVYLNTSDDSPLENCFESYEDALTFAQAWVDGIMAKDGIECEIVLTKGPPVIEDTTSIQDFITQVTLLTETLAKFSKVIQSVNKLMPDFEKTLFFARVHLGTVYAYNLLSGLKFLTKFPKLVLWIAKIIMWLFMHFPKWLILRWPSPALCD